jgi:Predicted dehydrogenases and related proteins
MKIGIAGSGKIVNTFLETLEKIEQIEAVAICARSKSKEKAVVIADKYKIAKIYVDYDLFLQDKGIDFVYIAVVNSEHFAYAKQALMAGKHVIMEKPFTSIAKEAEELVELAQKNKLFLFEAITVLYSPVYQYVKEHIDMIGDIKLIQCNYSQYSSRYDDFLQGNVQPAFDPRLSGGALYDILIYNVHFVMGILGKPKDVTYIANIAANGIDTSGIVTMNYDGIQTVCSGAKDSDSPGYCIIQGTKGYIRLEGSANMCTKADLVTNALQESFTDESYPIEYRMVHELLAFDKMFRNEDLRSCYKILEHSLQVMQTLNIARNSADIKFAKDN